MKRPGIVTFNALINLIFGVIFAALNIYLCIASNSHQEGALTLDVRAWDWDVVKVNGPFAILSLVAVCVFFGLWRLRPWGRTLFNILNIVLALGMAYLVFLAGIESTSWKIVWGVLGLIFLTAPLGMARPEVKEAFHG
jgi:hypothetical protein